MQKFFITVAGAFAVIMSSVAHAGGTSGGPVGGGDPPACDPLNDTCDGGGDGGDGGTGGDTGGGGGTGGTGTPGASTPYTFGTGAKLFTLDSLPTGPSGTQAYYAPGNQSGLLQTVGGTTVSFYTPTVAPTAAPTNIRVENDSSNFPYLGVPAGVGVGILATPFSPDAPDPIFVNFTDRLSYFSINLYRLSGGFDFNSTVSAYSGLNGTGTLLATISGQITGGNNFAFTTIELANLGGARSFTLQGNSFLANYDDVTATLGVPEPASWATMVGGFGIAGAALRRRRRQALRVV